MYHDRYVFSQIVGFLNRDRFNYLVRKYDGNRYVKHFSCWHQLLAMMFGQLCHREGLRDLIVALSAHQAKLYHLGLGRKAISKSTLATANQNRDYRIFEEFAFYMMKLACEKRAPQVTDVEGRKFAFDSTTIPLCLSTFPWAKFRKKKGGIKAHVLYDTEALVPSFYTISTASRHDSTAMREIPYEANAFYIFDRAYGSFIELYKIHLTGSFYIVRAKKNLQYHISRSRKRKLAENILFDGKVKLTGPHSGKKYPVCFRLIRVYDKEDDKELVLLTNAFDSPAEHIAGLYKQRWQVELFFKWLKQHLRIKRFWGTSLNSIRIQLSTAITAYCLISLIQHDLKLPRSTYEVLQIIGISLTDKTPLLELFSSLNREDDFDNDAVFLPGFFAAFG